MNENRFRSVVWALNLNASAWHLPPHRHPCHEMVIILSGRERVGVSGVSIAAQPGDVLVFRPGQDHEEWCDGKQPFRSVFIQFVCRDPTLKLALHSRDVHGRIRLLSTWMEHDRELPPSWAEKSKSVFLAAMIHELQTLQIPRQVDAMVSRVRAFVRQNLSAPIVLDSLARHAGLSKYHFLHRYRQVSGCTPMHDVRVLRLQQARDMVLTGKLPLKAIATQSGLGTESSMCRMFRRHYGITPGQLRQKMRL
jgi:AraC-like DNA-binding protein